MTKQQEAILTILESSDLHGSVLPIHYAANQPSETGIAKLASLIAKERSAGGHIIYIDNGDLIQGTPLAYHHARIDNQPADPMVSALNHLGCSAAVIGNHEFNYGMGVLNKAVKESAFPWLSANVVNKQTGDPYFGKPYMMKTFENGVRVAVLGLTTHYIPNWENPVHIEQLRFEDALQTAKVWVQRIREIEQPDVLIVSYHGGFEREPEDGSTTEVLTGENQGYAMCMEVPGIDVLLTGHQHRVIAEKSINGVTIVQPGHLGKFLGKLTVQLVHDGMKWSISSKRSELVSVEGIEPDPGIMELARPYEEKTQVWLDQPIGQLIGNMEIIDSMQVRTEDHPIIEFINKVQMEYAGAVISNTALFDNQSRGFRERITMRDVVSNYIYPNTLKVIRVNGKDIREALEQTAKYFAPWDGKEYAVSTEFTVPKPQHYNYDMWEGIEYEINISRPVGERVTKLLYQGKPVDPSAEFDVAMNNYRAGGGGNYFMFRGKPVIRDIPTDISELLANFILERGTIEASVDGNWRIVHD